MVIKIWTSSSAAWRYPLPPYGIGWYGRAAMVIKIWTFSTFLDLHVQYAASQGDIAQQYIKHNLTTINDDDWIRILPSLWRPIGQHIGDCRCLG